MKNKIVSIVYLVLRVIPATVFIYAGITKLGDVSGFAMSIDGYGMVSWRMAQLIAQVLPPIEIIAGIGLILDMRGALGMIVVQLLGFVCVLAYGISMGLDMDCGCFGPSGGTGESGGLWGALVRDLLMLVACLLLYWLRCSAGLSPRSVLQRFSSNQSE